MTSNEDITPTFDPDPDSEVKTPQEILEEMIDYIINHKDNLNGNILMEMLEYFDNDDGETPAPNPNPGGSIK